MANDAQHLKLDIGPLLDPQTVANSSVSLWERLAVELADIIGERGFHSLYSRALHQVRLSHPWLPDAGESGFDTLKTSLEQQEPSVACEASMEVLTVFIDTLTRLIGRSLCTTILQAAWGPDTMAPATKEINP